MPEGSEIQVATNGSNRHSMNGAKSGSSNGIQIRKNNISISSISSSPPRTSSPTFSISET
jgi:hypothetical protein